MFHTFVLVLLAFSIGIAVGVLLHAYFAKEAAATETELQQWGVKLRAAFNTDTQSAKAEVSKVAAEIEQKLHL